MENYREDANNKKKQKIIEKCIDESYQTRDNSSISMFGWKTKLFNFKDSVKYNLVNLNKKFIPQKASIQVLNEIYDPNNEKGKRNYYKKLNKILLFTYRSNYKEQISIKNNSKYTSDCGWGCMIRSSQMIFSRMIYKIFKHIYKNKFSSDIIIKSVIPFFMDDNIKMTEININSSDYINIGMENYIQRLNKYLEEKIISNKSKKLYIKSFDPPFSIHKICRIGEIFGRTCGEWFSDFELPKIYETINKTFNIIPNLSIMHFSTDIEIPKIINNCLEQIENADNLDKKDFFVNEKNEKYIFKKMGAIFVSVRLGLSSISPEYFLSIKKLFECKQFLGFIGGKVNSASYFFGYCDEDVLYLDPHFNQDSCTDLEKENFMTYFNKTVYRIPFKSLQCAFTIGFLFRDINEFRDLYLFFKYFVIDKYSCFHVQFEPYKSTYKLSQKEIENIYNDKDDF